MQIGPLTRAAQSFRNFGIYRSAIQPEIENLEPVPPGMR
jgi:hypothetical protein